MKKILFTFAFLLSAVSSMAQQTEDPVVMTVGSVPVTRSEFEYNFNKNNTDIVVDRKSVREYADLFAVYKLKVLAALDAGLEADSSFQKEFRHYRDLQIRPLLVPEVVVEKQCHDYYDGMLQTLGGKDLIRPAHILILVPQNADDKVLEEKRLLADSIYNALLHGADFGKLARELSNDVQTGRNDGALPWIGPGNTLEEFENVAYGLQVGQTSEPFLSPVGYHIVRMLERKQLEPFDSLHAQIHKFMERRGVHERLSVDALDSIVKKYDGKYTADQILDMETERLCAGNDELKYLVKEYHDGLLLYEFCSTRIWEPAKADTVGLERYFKDNRRAYAWDKPHFSGIVYYCKNKDDVKAVNKVLRKEKDDDKWVGIVREQFNKDSVTVRMDKRVFALGENNNVDALVFKVKDKVVKPLDGFPFVGFVGTQQKKGPGRWTDVSAKVIQDYQKAQEDRYVRELRKKYPVVIMEDVLTTVNNH
ncbi:MAG: peptidylprolyl isomerase [Bacteroidaceae bacterium]|nr:peptidylprolyl isomerase [Bacteroidaceae bacterium]